MYCKTLRLLYFQKNKLHAARKPFPRKAKSRNTIQVLFNYFFFHNNLQHKPLEREFFKTLAKVNCLSPNAVGEFCVPVSLSCSLWVLPMLHLLWIAIRPVWLEDWEERLEQVGHFDGVSAVCAFGSVYTQPPLRLSFNESYESFHTTVR